MAALAAVRSAKVLRISIRNRKFNWMLWKATQSVGSEQLH
jgi:hypothetical protein